MKCFILASLCFALLFTSVAHAKLYKCTDDKGEISFSDKPCRVKDTTNWSKESSRESDARKRTAENAWDLIQYVDKMTDEAVCLIVSGKGFIGSKGNDFFFVSLRVIGLTDGSYIVTIQSEKSGFSDSPAPLFHNDKDDLGIRVDDNQFIPVGKDSKQRTLAFNINDSTKIIEQLKSGNRANLRVRYWPYDDRYDGGDIELGSFNKAFQSLNKCLLIDHSEISH